MIVATVPMTVPTVFTFSDDRAPRWRPSTPWRTVAGGATSSPNVEEEVPDMKVNYFGLRLNKGVTVASFVTAPARKGVAQPSTLGVLHSRSRLGTERIARDVGRCAVRRCDRTTTPVDCSSRSPSATPAAQVLDGDVHAHRSALRLRLHGAVGP